MLSAGQPLDVALPQPVSVHFAYVTAWADADGRVQFRSDLYGQDGIEELVASYSRAGGERPSTGAAPAMSP